MAKHNPKKGPSYNRGKQKRAERRATEVDSLKRERDLLQSRYSELENSYSSLKKKIGIKLENTIVREIHFAPEVRQSGISVLSYFSEFLRNLHPDLDIAVSIQQVEDKVVLSIQYPDGTEDLVERSLNSFGQIVRGEMSADEVLSNPYDVAAINHRLEISRMELNHVRELHAIKSNAQEAEIKTLRNELDTLKNSFGTALITNMGVLESLSIELAKSQKVLTASVTANMQLLIESMVSGNEEQGMSAIEEIKTEDPGVLEALNDLIIKGAISGASGNYLFQWLNTIGMALPK